MFLNRLLKSMKNTLFILLLLSMIFGYKWIAMDEIRIQNTKIIPDDFSEEYNGINNDFIIALNYVMPIVDIAYKTQGYTGRDLTFASILNIYKDNPTNIIKYQIPIFAQQNTKKNEYSQSNSKTESKSNDNNKNSSVPPINNTSTPVNNTNNPLILIYHTHTMESFVATQKYNYIASYGFDRSGDLNFSIAKVGDYLTYYLQHDYNISVLHNKTIHDYNYDESYNKSRSTVTKLLNQYQSIKVMIDLHRDGFGGIMKPGIAMIPDLSKLPNQDYRKKYVININGQNVAKVMFVIGSRRSQNTKEDYKNNYNFAKSISDKLNQLYPGISLGVEIHQYSTYNQDLLDKGILIELGCNENTLEEAIGTTPYLAKAMSSVLKDYKLTN